MVVEAPGKQKGRQRECVLLRTRVDQNRHTTRTGRHPPVEYTRKETVEMFPGNTWISPKRQKNWKKGTGKGERRPFKRQVSNGIHFLRRSSLFYTWLWSKGSNYKEKTTRDEQKTRDLRRLNRDK